MNARTHFCHLLDPNPNLKRRIVGIHLRTFSSVSLSSPSSSPPSGKLRNALLKRAIADIPIILRMQNEGPGIYNMYQQAMIGEKEWHAFQE